MCLSFSVNCMELLIPNILQNGFKNMKEDTIKLIITESNAVLSSFYG